MNLLPLLILLSQTVAEPVPAPTASMTVARSPCGQEASADPAPSPFVANWIDEDSLSIAFWDTETSTHRISEASARVELEADNTLVLSYEARNPRLPGEAFVMCESSVRVTVRIDGIARGDYRVDVVRAFRFEAGKITAQSP